MKTANKWLKALPLRNDIEFNDLVSEAYIAMCDAVSTYKTERGAFTTWYGYYLKSAYTALYGLRTARLTNDPLNTAISIDAPLAGDTEDYTLFASAKIQI